MGYRLLADGVLIVHLGFVAFVVIGALLAFRWPKLVWLHLPALFWGAYIEFSGRVCPLTPLENWLRIKGGMPGYSTGFVERYILPLIYPVNLTRNTQIILGLLVLGINVVIYGAIVIRYRSRINKI